MNKFKTMMIAVDGVIAGNTYLKNVKFLNLAFEHRAFFYFDLNQKNHLLRYKIFLKLPLLVRLYDILSYHPHLAVQLNFENGEIEVFLLLRSFLIVFLVTAMFEFFLPLDKILILQTRFQICYVLQNSLMDHHIKT